MGCFDKTCMLSNTAIKEGDRAVVIVLDNECFPISNIVRGNAMIQRRKIRQNEPVIDAITQSFIENPDSGFKKHFFAPVDGVEIGVYNDYGSLHESKIELNDSNAVWFHEWAAKHLLSAEKETDLNVYLPDNSVELAAFLMYNLMTYRKPFLDGEGIGEQHDSIHEMRKQIQLNELTNKFLQKRIDFYENENIEK